MIKYLTEKLKQHTLDERQHDYKIAKNNDYDSGTESDDQIPYSAMTSTENDRCNDNVSNSGAIINTGGACGLTNAVTPASSPYFLDSALPSDCDLTYDHHSSEEELEVINGGKLATRNAVSKVSVASSSSTEMVAAKRASQSAFDERRRSVCSVLPEKRKWSDAMDADSPLSFRNAVAGSNSSSNSNSPLTISTATATTIAANVDGSGRSWRSTPSYRSRLRISNRRRMSASDENCLVARRGCTSRCDRKITASCNSAASSDDESIIATTTTATSSGDDAFAPIAPSTPVNFSRSPPLNAHKPPTIRSLSPPLKMINCGDDSTALVVPLNANVDQQQQRSQNVSSLPRYKRHRFTPTQRSHHAHNIQRPCLDFEKMQQMKENAVTTWRHYNGGEHGGELSLYCW